LPHRYGREGTGTFSFSTILKIILNDCSPKTSNSVRFRRFIKGEEEAKARGGKRSGYDTLSCGLGCREPQVTYALHLLKMQKDRHFCSRHPNTRGDLQPNLYSCLS